MQRLACLFIVLTLLGPLPSLGQDASPADRAAIEEMILSQLEAFKRDDAAGAYAYASPTIQEKFRDPDSFISMVKQGYGQIYRSRKARFLKNQWVEGQLVQEVEILGADGVLVVAAYVMQRQPDGSWKINGVYLRQARDSVS